MSHTFSGRKCLILLPLVFFITIAVCPSRIGFGSLEQNRSSLQSVKDMITVADDTGVKVYVSDPISGGIYYAERPVEDLGSLNFSDFKLLRRTAPDYPKPSGLAYSKQKLIVCDPVANAIFEIDLSSSERQLKRLSLHHSISAPEYVAVSDSGVIAIASDKEVEYFLPGTEEPRVATKEIRDVDRLILDGRALLVLDEDGPGDLFSFNVGPFSFETQIRQYFTKPLSSAMRDILPRIQDFALHRGLYYIAGHTDISIFARTGSTSKGEPIVLSLSLPSNTSIDKIAVSPGTIYVAETNKQSILAIKRPVPMLVDFPQADAASISNQIGILELMEKQGAMVKRSIVTQSAYATLYEFIRKELFSELQDPSVQPDNDSLFRTAQIICKLNDWRCVEQKTRVGLVLEREKGNIGLKNEVIVPASKVKGQISWKTYQSPSGANDFETYVTGLDVIPLDNQTNSLNAGQIVHVEKGFDGAPKIIGQCDTGTSEVVDVTPTSFPTEVVVSPEDFVRQVGLKVSASDLQKWGVSQIVANYSDVQYSRLKLSAPEKYKLCFSDSTDLNPETYIIDRVLWASAARYKFLDRKGKTLSLDQRTSGWFSSIGKEDPASEWSWILPNRLNLGYVALNFFTAASGQQTPRIGYLKPTKRVIKVYAQQFTVLVDANKIGTLLSDVNKLAENSAVPFYASSAQTQRFPAVERSILPNESPNSTIQNLTIDEARKERDNLTKLIHFNPRLSELDLGQWKVGVVENLGTIEDHHQCFYDAEGVWTWWVDADTGEPTGDPIIDQTPGTVNEALPDGEHGTHVAGIIAARSVLPGLLPKLRLVKIDSGNFTAEVENKFLNVKTFNLSTDPPGLASAYDGIINKIRDNKFGGGEILLIVAAGNAEKDKAALDYGNTEPTKPVVWLRRIPDNMIVVGASTSSKPILRLPSSNYSKKFVQLFAPGDRVFSASKGNHYAPASGTSFAAPQVTAVAALLRSKGLSPSWTKAVLIYTADWDRNIMEAVWGGILNAERAFESTLDAPNNIWLKKDQVEPISVKPVDKAYNITINPGFYENDPNQDAASQQRFETKTIPFDNLLRVQQMGGGLYRVVYLDKDGEFKMLIEAQISGEIRCVVQKDKSGNILSNDECSKYPDPDHDGKYVIRFDRVFDYIKRVPTGKFVKFSPPKG